MANTVKIYVCATASEKGVVDSYIWAARSIVDSKAKIFPTAVGSNLMFCGRLVAEVKNIDEKDEEYIAKLSALKTETGFRVNSACMCFVYNDGIKEFLTL